MQKITNKIKNLKINTEELKKKRKKIKGRVSYVIILFIGWRFYARTFFTISFKYFDQNVYETRWNVEIPD